LVPIFTWCNSIPAGDVRDYKMVREVDNGRGVDKTSIKNPGPIKTGAGADR